MTAALPGLDRAGEVDRPGKQQQLFGQGGFTRIGVRDNAEGPAARHFARNPLRRRTRKVRGDGLEGRRVYNGSHGQRLAKRRAVYRLPGRKSIDLSTANMAPAQAPHNFAVQVN